MPIENKVKRILGSQFYYRLWQDANITAAAVKRKYGCPTFIMAGSAD